MRNLIVASLLLFAAPVLGAEVCDVSKDPKDTDFPPLHDKDYAPQAALAALDKLAAYFNARAQGLPPPEYAVPENYLVVIEGANLLDSVRAKQSRLTLAKSKGQNTVYEESDLKESTEKYCAYRKSHFLADW